MATKQKQKRRDVTLTDGHVAMAVFIGGNASSGIRKALELHTRAKNDLLDALQHEDWQIVKNLLKDL